MSYTCIWNTNVTKRSEEESGAVADMFRNSVEWGKVINVGNKKGEVKRGMEKRLSDHEARMECTRDESLNRKDP